MKKYRNLNIAGLIINILIAVMAITGFSMSFISNANSSLSSGGFASFKYFTNLSNLLVALTCLINIPFNIACIKKEQRLPKAAFIIKLIGTSAVTLTFLIVYTYLWQVLDSGIKLFYDGAMIFTHTLVPLTSILSLIFIDQTEKIKYPLNLLSLLPLLAYAVYYISGNVSIFTSSSLNSSNDWYHLIGLWYKDGMSLGLTILGVTITIVVMLLIMLIISTLLWTFNRLLSRPFEEEKKIDTTTSEEDAKQEVVETSSTPIEETKPNNVNNDEVKQEVKSSNSTSQAPNLYNGKTRTYHISKQKTTGDWQVKLAGGQKAIKIFKTQKQAIEYAKELVKTQGGSIRIHMVNGQIRKE